MQIDWNVIVEFLPNLVAGAQVTLAMTGLALLVGIVVGLALALARISGIRIISWPAYAYIEFFRTTPPLVQIIWFYFVLPVLIGTELNSFQAASAALGFNIAAFLAEIFRAGIQGIEATQRDAARVLGLRYADTFRFVVLPQAIRIVLHPTTTTLMLLLKSTALVSMITVTDLTRAGMFLRDDTHRNIEIFSMLLLLYFGLSLLITATVRWLERRFSHGMDHGGAA